MNDVRGKGLFWFMVSEHLSPLKWGRHGRVYSGQNTEGVPHIMEPELGRRLVLPLVTNPCQ